MRTPTPTTATTTATETSTPTTATTVTPTSTTVTPTPTPTPTTPTPTPHQYQDQYQLYCSVLRTLGCRLRTKSMVSPKKSHPRLYTLLQLQRTSWTVLHGQYWGGPLLNIAYEGAKDNLTRGAASANQNRETGAAVVLRRH